MDWTALRISLMGEGKKSLVPARVKLPILPLAVTKFSQRSSDPNATPKELGQIIESDSGLTCELLRYVNSSARGMSQKVTSAQQAISLLGVRDCKLYLLTKAVDRALRGRESKLVNLRSFAATNLERALFAKYVAKLLRTDGETAFAAAMLQDFMLPAITNDLFSTYLPFSKEQEESQIDLHRFEQKAQKWDHAEAAAHVMLAWGFPDELVCCALLHHRGLKLLADKTLGRTPAAAVAVSALIPDALRQVFNGMDQLIALDSKWPSFDLMAAAEQVDREFQELSPVTGANPFSFLRHCRKALSVA
ncbi:MAG: HDOD domain-containing protein [Planctomycetaceae bacterium]|jgi:HD-like signal output (HDOD) protein|nr:HDOD domain-containing protein [Planctomycetaceae bacterium]MBT6483668.1 HDOD domain-containing protein [Planctomycetaceae bacterium]MBT6496289.1 HDOD domain-containing protein [Planctomycetaceae bacterium]